jgi:prepilin-type N-terminal cleavage/methylation domain-containing protein
MITRNSGFSLVELLVAMGVMAAISSALIALVMAGQSIARTQPEAADLQQRARVAMQTLASDVMAAGAGLDRTGRAGPLVRYFPPVAPAIGGGLTLWFASNRDAQAALAEPVAVGATQVTLADNGVCPVGQPACGFSAATTAILFDAGGCRDVLRINSVAADALQFQNPLVSCGYAPGAAIAQGEVLTYRVDPIAKQLLRRDEATGRNVPVLDSVASMQVDYYQDYEGSPLLNLSDPDLLRVRRLSVTLRFVSSNPRLLIPDLVVAFDLAPPNLQERW